jgi:hypothetical protein
VEESARKFLEENPHDPRAGSIRQLEVTAALRAQDRDPEKPEKRGASHSAKAKDREEKAEAFVADPNNQVEDRIAVKSQLQRRAERELSDKASREARRLQNARKLISDFPDSPRGHGQLLALAKSHDGARSKELAIEVASSEKAPAAMKSQALRLAQQRDMEGKPLELPGVDFAKHKGKPVILYTWSLNRPDVFESVRQWTREGADCVGINVDNDSDLARSLVLKANPPGVQLYEKPGGPIIQALKSGGAPVIYIFDDRGILKDTNGYLNTRGKLRQLVEGKKGKS